MHDPARSSGKRLLSIYAFGCALSFAGCGSSGGSDPSAAGAELTPAPGAARDCEQTAAVVEDVSVENAQGALQGSFSVPLGCGPFPTFLIIAGSGATDRDGNGPSIRTDAYRLLAESLAARGIASLRYDKAGVGASRAAAPTSSAELVFETGADDAALWLSLLRQEARVGRLLIAGHSEGSLLGMLAAERVPVDGYVSLEGAGRPIADVLREQLGRSLTGALLEQSNTILAELEAGRGVTQVPAALAPLFSPVVQPYLISWMHYDPAAELAQLTQPALIVQGTTDTQVGVPDAERLAAARPDAQLLVVEGMSHVLKLASSDPLQQQAAYTEPSLPLVAELVDTVVDFAQR